MLFKKLRDAIREYSQREKKEIRITGYATKFLHFLNKKEKEHANKMIKTYLEDIMSLKRLKLNTQAAKSLAFDIQRDTMNNLISFEDLRITEDGLRALLREQEVYNLRIQFNLLKEDLWYRIMVGDIVIKEMEYKMKKENIKWEELRIYKSEFSLIKRHVTKAAK